MIRTPIQDPIPRRVLSRSIFATSLAALAFCGASAHAAQEVSRAEYEQMKRELAELRQEMKALRSTASVPAPASAKSAPKGALGQSFAEMSDTVNSLRSGEIKALVTGGAEATFTAARNSASNFSAVFEPLLLWHINDRLLFEGAVEFELEGSGTKTKLEYAQIDWTLNDYITLVGGKFLNPVNNYVERYTPTWIRKLPDNPLGLYDGFLPESNLGAQIRGVVPIGNGRINLAAYVSNAPKLVTDDPEALGSLQFDNWNSQADSKAFGGRIGLMPCQNFEIGYGVQSARVRGDGTKSVSSLIQSVDLSAHTDAAKGRIALLGQYAWSKTGDFTYDADGSLGVGPLRYSNHRDGGYAQLSYRGKQWDSDLMNHLEFIVRGDVSNAPNDAPGGFDERRLTFGIDYWIASSTVLKAAYEIDHRNNNEPNGDAILFQLSTGF